MDGITTKKVIEDIGIDEWLTTIQNRLQRRKYQPAPVKRTYIPKGSGKMRPLGIPTLEDRLVQMALKIVLEPIFEAKFKNCSNGFRPGRGPWQAMSQIWSYMRPRNGYEWVIEADLKSCFDNIDHGLLLQRIKMKVKDKKVLALIKAFLKAGVLKEGIIHYPVSGSPQGGVISPLLANIYLDILDDYYHNRFHFLSPSGRRYRLSKGRPMMILHRYADDFIILVKGTREQADQGLEELRNLVRTDLRMELAEEKTGVHSLEEGFEFLGFRVWRGTSQCTGRVSTVIIPSKEAEIRFRRKVKEITSRRNRQLSLSAILGELNRLIRGWGNYFRWGWIFNIYAKLDYYIWGRVRKWLRKKHPKRTWTWVRRKYLHPQRHLNGVRVWADEQICLIKMKLCCRSYDSKTLSGNVVTPYNRPMQTSLTRFHDISFSDNVSLLSAMERSLLRQRSGGEPDEVKASRPVRETAGGNGVRKSHRASC
jgi:group II intron reverse transcriptase/maturase